MAWQTPKIDWTSSDYYNLEDADRIAGNIDYLKNRCIEIFPDTSIAILFYRQISLSGYFMYSPLQVNLNTLNVRNYSRGFTSFASSEQNNWYIALMLTVLWSAFRSGSAYMFPLFSDSGTNKAAIDSTVSSGSTWVPRYWYEGYGFTIRYNGTPSLSKDMEYLYTNYWSSIPSNYPFELDRVSASGKSITRLVLNYPLQNKPFWKYSDLNMIENRLRVMHDGIVQHYGE